MENSNQTRNYKDTVFVDLFAKCPEAKENFLSLYNALHGTSLTLKDTTVEPVMLEQTVYTGRYNDVSMLVNKPAARMRQLRKERIFCLPLGEQNILSGIKITRK